LQTVADARGCDPADEELQIRVTMVLASILSFRTLRNVTFGSLGWSELTSGRLERLDRTIRQIARRELLDGLSAARGTDGCIPTIGPHATGGAAAWPKSPASSGRALALKRRKVDKFEQET
jgi:hypothetical protein